MPEGKEPERAYTVLKTDQLTRLSDTQGIEYYYRVKIKTRGGTILTVFIEPADYTPEKTAPILKAVADNADKISRLG